MGTEKVQTGVVGGRRFLLFFLLDAFFLKSLTASETPQKKKKKHQSARFSPHTKTVMSLFIHGVFIGGTREARLNTGEGLGHRVDVT